MDVLLLYSLTQPAVLRIAEDFIGQGLPDKIDIHVLLIAQYNDRNLIVWIARNGCCKSFNAAVMPIDRPAQWIFPCYPSIPIRVPAVEEGYLRSEHLIQICFWNQLIRG